MKEQEPIRMLEHGKHGPKLRPIAARDLVIDPSVQRPISRAAVRRLADNMNLDVLGVCTVSERANGTTVILDGQNRKLSLEHIGFGDWKLNCSVYHDLTKEQEAELFRKLNTTRHVGAFDDYDKGVIANDQECLEIRGAAKAVGLNITRHQANGCVNCVSALREVYRAHGVDALKNALGTAVAAWGPIPLAVESALVRGLSLMHASYDGVIDMARLVKKLSKRPGGPGTIISDAKNVRKAHSAPIYRLVASVIIAEYNKGARNKLAAL